MKRLGIFFFYDEHGIADEYVYYMLRKMNVHLERLIVVCNGKLRVKDRKKFGSITDDYFVRTNVGFNVFAYKEAFEYVGWNNIYQYDELIMFDYTMAGPVFELSEMFDEMEKQGVDFWGVSKFHKNKLKGNCKIPYDYLPEHIQSYFLAVRGDMLRSLEFRKHWDNMKPINNYNEAVSYHEIIFTKKFEDYGFCWSVYADTSYLEGKTNYPLMYCPADVMRRARCPFFVKQSFFEKYDDFMHNNTGESSVEMYRFINEETDYSLDMVWKHILRTCHMSDIAQALHLEYVLSSQKANDIHMSMKIGVILYISENNCFDSYSNYLTGLMQINIEVIVIYHVNNNLKQIESILKRYGLNNVAFVPLDNDENYYSVLCRKLRELSGLKDFIGVLHFNLLLTHPRILTEEAIIYSNLQNLVVSQSYIINIFNLFHKNERLGMISAPLPLQADYTKYIGYEWGQSVSVLKDIAAQYLIPFEISKPSSSPYTGMYWCRGTALNKLFEYTESIELTHPLYHYCKEGFSSFDASLSMFTQAAGYYSARVMNDMYASIELTNLRFHLKMLKTAASPNTDNWHTFNIKTKISMNKDLFK